jgi:hypothetical protein
MYKKIGIMIIFIFLALSITGTVSAKEYNYNIDGKVGNVNNFIIFENSDLNYAFSSDLPDVFDKSGLYNKTGTSNLKALKATYYEYTAVKAGAITIESHLSWTDPIYYHFNITA